MFLVFFFLFIFVVIKLQNANQPACTQRRGKKIPSKVSRTKLSIQAKCSSAQLYYNYNGGVIHNEIDGYGSVWFENRMKRGGMNLY